MSDLAERFRRLIRAHGPIPVNRFMGESNALYYSSRDPLGAPKEEGGGDFVTAPDISQMFGEIIGLWLTDLWSRAGRPSDAVYVELGPGRGTLAADALRVMHAQGFAPQVHFVEGSPVLRKSQAEAVPGALFHDDLSTLPDGVPLLVVANEFLDALPIRQLVRAESGWRERLIALEGESLAFVAGLQPMDLAIPPVFASAPPGTILETCPGAAAAVEEVARRLAQHGGAALFIDYGHLQPRTGSTLQAVRAHRKIDPLSAPGEADLTAHVDFTQLAQCARAAGAQWLSATSQGQWLRSLGIEQRAAALASREPDRAGALAADLARLVQPEDMGDLFKVAAFGAGGWPPAAGFA